MEQSQGSSQPVQLGTPPEVVFTDAYHRLEHSQCSSQLGTPPAYRRLEHSHGLSQLGRPSAYHRLEYSQDSSLAGQLDIPPEVVFTDGYHRLEHSQGSSYCRLISRVGQFFRILNYSVW